MSGGRVVGTVPQPSLCDQCGPEFVRELEADPSLTVAAKYCPHTCTVACAFLGEHDAGRVIRRWMQESPVEPDEAPVVMARLAEVVGATGVVNLRPTAPVQ